MSPLAAVCSASPLVQSAARDCSDSLQLDGSAQEIVFVDGGVDAPEQLVAGVIAGAEVHLLRGGDAIAQITAILQDRKNIANIHLITHGAPGRLYLGDIELSLDSLPRYGAQLKTWLGAETSLLLYGCNVAAGAVGQAFLNQLYEVVRRPIFASARPVGQADLGGVWQLEGYGDETVSREGVSLAIAPETQKCYPGLFAEIISFSATPNAGEEANQTTIRLEVTTDGNVTGDQIVELGLKLNSTATGSDFESLTPGSITIANGSNTGFIEFSVKDDEIVEGSETAFFTLNNPSPGLTIAPSAREIGVTITDNEIPQVTDFRINTTTGAEDGETTITLTAEAVQAVQGDQVLRVSLSGSATVEDFRVEAGFPADLVIRDGQRTGTLSFPVRDDNLIEYLETATFTLTQPDTTTGVTLGTVEAQTLTIEDDDFPIVSLSLSTTEASEAGQTVITVTPTVSEPVRGNQTVALAFSGLQTTDFSGTVPTVLTIPNGASSGTPFSITVIDDALIEGTETGLFTLSNASDQLSLGETSSYGVTIADNDFPVVTLSASTTTATEADRTQITFTATASQAVTADQTVQIDFSGSARLSDFTPEIPTTLTLADGQTTASFSVAIADDAAVEGAETATFSLSNASGGLVLGNPNQITQTINITDNDFPTVTLDVTPTGATEAGQTEITVTVTASEAVSSDQTVQLDLTGGVSLADFAIAPPPQLTIPAGQSSVSNSFRIADDALVEDAETATFTLGTASDGIRLGSTNDITRTVSITDNDFPLINVSIDQAQVQEGDSVTFKLTTTASEPVKGDQTYEIAMGGAQPEDFVENFPLIVTIPDGQTVSEVEFELVNDALVEGTENAVFTIQSPSAGLALGGTTSVGLAIADNDFPAVNLTANTTTASETDRTSIILTATAAAPVEGNQTVSLSLGGDASTSNADFFPAVPTQLTILNGQTVGSVTFAVQDDGRIEGAETARFAIDPLSNGIVPGNTTSVEIQLSDNDIAGFEILQTNDSTEVEESGTGNTDRFTVQLTAQPETNVVIDIAGADPTAATLSSSSLTFSSTNWNQPQTVTVSGVDNDIIDADKVSNLTLSINEAQSDGAFDAVADQALTVTTRNDDAAGIAITESGGATTVSEAGSSDSFDVTLTAEPSSPVTLTVAGNSDTGEVRVDTTTLTFDPSNWNQPQTVTVTGVDDEALDGNQTTSVVLSVDAAVSDNAFDAVLPATIAVTTIDDDTPGITVTPTSGLRTTEDGGTAEFEIVLSKQPSAGVAIALTGNPTEGSLSVSNLSFTPNNWDQPQTVTITGVDDQADDGDFTYSIVTMASSDDAGYAAIDPDDVEITNVDNDENRAPVLAAALEDQTANAAAPFSFSLPSGTFVDEDPWDEALVYSATLVGGASLPGWIDFDATGLTFNGTPTVADVGSFAVNLTASDRAGLSANDTFLITVAQPAPAPVPTPLPTPNPEPTPAPAPAPAPAPVPESPESPSEPVAPPLAPLEPVTTFGLSLLQGRSDRVNELIVVATDDFEGRIDGLAPQDVGYQDALLARAQVVFSTLKRDRLSGLETNRTINLASQGQFRFALIQNGSLDSLRQGGAGELQLAVTPDGREIIEASTLAVEGTQLRLGLPGGVPGGDILLASSTGGTPPLGSGLQGNGSESEMFDFRGETGTRRATFEVYRDAVFDNLVGFYFVENEQGQVRDGFGNLINPGDEGYAAAALANRLPEVELTGSNGSVETFSVEIVMGQLLSAFVIVDGTVGQLLDAEAGNDPSIYFTHLGANRDGADHVRLLGDNTFGFEDLVNGGDMDFDDIVVKATFA